MRSPTVYFLMVSLPERGCIVFPLTVVCAKSEKEMSHYRRNGVFLFPSANNLVTLLERGYIASAHLCFPLISANILTGETPLVLRDLAVSQFLVESRLSLTCSLYKIAVCLKVAVSSRRHRNSDIATKFNFNKNQTPLL